MELGGRNAKTSANVGMERCVSTKLAIVDVLKVGLENCKFAYLIDSNFCGYIG